MANGMIFAAGLGTRLAPLTDTRPKALVEVCGRPLLDYALTHFAESGIGDIVVNVHHKADQIKEYIESHRSKWRAQIVISDESDLLLDTGGGLAKALPLFANDGPVTVGNADVLSDADLADLATAHKQSGADATLLMGSRRSTRNLLFGNDGRLCGWRDTANDKERMARETEVAYAEAFNGFHVIEQRLIRSFGEPRPMPIVSAYLDRAEQFDIRRHPMAESRYWFDVGTVEKLRAAEQAMSARR